MAGHYESKPIAGTEDPVTGFPKFQDVWVEDAAPVASKTTTNTNTNTNNNSSATPSTNIVNGIDLGTPKVGAQPLGQKPTMEDLSTPGKWNNNTSIEAWQHSKSPDSYDTWKNKMDALIRQGSISNTKTATNTLLAYDTNNNNAPVYVTPGTYIPGISLTAPTTKKLGDFMDKTLNDQVSSNELTPSNIPTVTETQTGEYSDEFKSNIETKLSPFREEGYKVVTDEQTANHTEYKSIVDKLNTTIQSITDEVALSKTNTEKMDAAYKVANIEGEINTQKDLLASIKSLMTTVYKDTPSGAVAMSTISDQNFGTFVGLYSALQASQGYTTNATNTITSYYKERSIQISDRITALQNTASILSSRANALTVQDTALTADRINLLREEQAQIDAKQNLLNTAITSNPQAFSVANIDLENDSYDTILQKLGDATSQVSTFNEMKKKYYDLDITPDMTISEMTKKLSGSSLYAADLKKQEKANGMSDAQIYSRATAKQLEYANMGKWISYEDAEAAVRGEAEVKTTYGTGLYDSLQTKLASAIGGITDKTTKLQYVQLFDNAIKKGDIDSAAYVINEAAYTKGDNKQKAIIDNAKSAVSGLNTALTSINAYTANNLGILKKFENTVMGKINGEKDKEAGTLKAEIDNAAYNLRVALTGTNVSLSEIGLTEDMFPNSEDTVSSAKYKLSVLQKYTYVKELDMYDTLGGIDINDDIGKVFNAYKENVNAAGLIDELYATDNNIPPAKILQAIQSIQSNTESGSGDNLVTDIDKSAARYDAEYIGVVNNNIKTLYNGYLNETARKVATSYPQGTIGGQCGTFAKTITNRNYTIGDTLGDKQLAVQKYGTTDISKATIIPGNTIIFNTTPTTLKDGTSVNYGHVAVVGKYNPLTNEVTLIESNYHKDEKVTINRVIDLDKATNIYGLLPTQFSGSFTYNE